MALPFRKLHRHFVAESSPIALRNVHDPETLAEIRRPFDDAKYRRELRGVTALDIEQPALVASGS